MEQMIFDWTNNQLTNWRLNSAENSNNYVYFTQ